MLRKSVFVVLLLTFISANTGMAFAQISGGFGFPCSEDLVDLVAICAAHIVCTKPPDPIDSFDIGARSFATCSNQPVDNFASIDARISGVQALATAQATALFYDRLIHREVRAGDEPNDFIDGNVRPINDGAGRIDNLVQIVRRDIRRHTDRDAGRTVHQQIR